MAATKAKAAHASRADTSEAVDEFMAALDHPHKAGIEALRRIITRVDRSVREGVKWNAPSWRTTEYFATTHLRAKVGVGVILHLGAKVRNPPAGGIAIEDPAGLLEWLGKDRAMVGFRDDAAIAANAKAFEAVLRQWLRHV